MNADPAMTESSVRRRSASPFTGAVRLAREFASGAAGTTLALLVPRASSFVAQWLLAWSAGSSSVTKFITIAAHGTVVTSLFAAGLPPTIATRPGSLASSRSRALIGGAVGAIATVVWMLTFFGELAVARDSVQSAIVATFAALSIFATIAVAVWPIWQQDGLYARVFGALFVAAPLMAGSAAALGAPRLTSLSVAVAGAMPALYLIGRTKLVRAVRYGWLLTRQAVPLSLTNVATVAVFPLALEVCTRNLGTHVVGRQALLWSCVLGLNMGSAAVATNAIARHPRHDDRRAALRKWGIGASLLGLASTAIYLGFAITGRAGHERAALSAMPPTLMVGAIAFIVSDPLCFYFSEMATRRRLAIGSMLCAVIVAGVELGFARPLAERLGLFGPSALVAILRLWFVADASIRRTAMMAAWLLTAAFILAGTLR